jgi:hypothetical protein
VVPSNPSTRKSKDDGSEYKIIINIGLTLILPGRLQSTLLLYFGCSKSHIRHGLGMLGMAFVRFLIGLCTVLVGLSTV